MFYYRSICPRLMRHGITLLENSLQMLLLHCMARHISKPSYWTWYKVTSIGLQQYQTRWVWKWRSWYNIMEICYKIERVGAMVIFLLVEFRAWVGEKCTAFLGKKCWHKTTKSSSPNFGSAMWILFFYSMLLRAVAVVRLTTSISFLILTIYVYLALALVLALCYDPITSPNSCIYVPLLRIPNSVGTSFILSRCNLYLLTNHSFLILSLSVLPIIHFNILISFMLLFKHIFTCPFHIFHIRIWTCFFLPTILSLKALLSLVMVLSNFSLQLQPYRFQKYFSTFTILLWFCTPYIPQLTIFVKVWS